jgi:tripartite-type tricarboxylate transporter receptor subunit TctC
MKRRTLLSFAGAAAAMGMAPLARAQPAAPFPSQPVKIVVATLPGTVMDVSSRAISKVLEPRWKQPVLTLNVAGAGGSIGADQVAKAAPDGHTLLLGHEGIVVIAPLLADRLTKGPRQDVRPVVNVTETDVVLIVNRAKGIQSLADLIARAQAAPEKLTYGSPGLGTPVHLRMEIFMREAGIRLLHVPYKGGAAALADVLGGQVDCTMVSASVAAPYASDKLRVLAVSNRQRNALFPEVQTFGETLPNLHFTTWFGMFAPAQTPREIVDFIGKEISDAVRSPELSATFLKVGIQPVGGTPEDLERVMQSDFAAYSRLFQQKDFKPT